MSDEVGCVVGPGDEVDHARRIRVSRVDDHVVLYLALYTPEKEKVYARLAVSKARELIDLLSEAVQP